MNLQQAKEVLESLQELSPNVEDFSWGPSYEFAKERQNKAIKHIKKLIKELEHQKLKKDIGAGSMDSLDKCPECGGTFVWKMAGGGYCTACSHNEICF